MYFHAFVLSDKCTFFIMNVCQYCKASALRAGGAHPPPAPTPFLCPPPPIFLNSWIRPCSTSACSFESEKIILPVLSATRHFLTMLPSFVLFVVPVGASEQTALNTHTLARLVCFEKIYSGGRRGGGGGGGGGGTRGLCPPPLPR